MENNCLTLTKINNVPVQVVIESGSELVPIKPICELLGIAFQSQYEKIRNDDFLLSTVTLSVTVGADSKDRSMVCLPLKYVFGWLFTINPANVRPEARETVSAYRQKCYDVLYDYFEGNRKFIAYKQKLIDDKIRRCREIRFNFAQTKKSLYEAEKELDQARLFSEADYETMLNL